MHLYTYKTNQKIKFEIFTSASLFLSPSPSSIAAAWCIISIAKQLLFEREKSKMLEDYLYLTLIWPELACLPSPLVSPTAQLGDAYKLAPAKSQPQMSK